MTVHRHAERDGAVVRLVLDHGKGNVLDTATVGALRDHIGALDDPRTKLVVFDSAGPHFSFGASVQEHMPGEVADMLLGFHALFRELEELGVPTAAIVRGQCLGGGFELAMFTGWVFCEPGARFAVPEVTLGVFPPMAALMLRWRTGGGLATRMVVTGQAVAGDEAVAAGIADVCAADPEAALWEWYDARLAPLSAVAVRHAWRAVRRPVAQALAKGLAPLEDQYLGELMACADPVEGLTAFLERRPPQWSHR